ncbi:MAG: co-chaperone GroES [Acidimicrobiia bacterium]|nr:co-chaperone GroES [Acidimicrobiia bacterium]
MNLKPLGDRVIVRPKEGEETLPSGIVLPDTAKEKPQEGEVLAAGRGEWHDDELVPLEVEPGDIVIFSKYGGTEITVEGEDVLILSARDLLAVVDKK